MWRIPEATEGGSLKISGNIFGYAPVGAAIYSIVSPEAEAQVTLSGNGYTPNPLLLNRWNGTNFVSLSHFKKKTEKDTDGFYL